MRLIYAGGMDDTSAGYQLYVGIDVAADTFTAAWLAPGGTPTAPLAGDQTPAGSAALPRRLQATAVPPAATLVVLEATGTYWVALAVALHEAGYRVAVVHPRQAHHCAKAQLRRAKTDALDAQDLARLAAALQPAPWTPPPPVYHEARQRLVARDGLLALRTQARHQRHALLPWPVVVEGGRQHRDELIVDLDRRIASLQADLAAVLAASEWAEARACVTSAPGLGRVTAAWLLVGTLNFTRCAGPTPLTAYTGLAPMPRESGRSVRGRSSIGHGGNGRLRTALSTATLSAARYNPAIRTFYARLRAAGKPPKVARCAAARKLLHLAWALGTKRRRFDPDHRQQHEAPPARQLAVA